MGFIEKFNKVWNAFKDEETHQTLSDLGGYGRSSNIQTQSHFRSIIGDSKTIISTIYNRIAIDVAAVEFRHARVDDEGRYESDMNSLLNDCLTVEANIDQAAQQFRIDMAMSLFEQGNIAIVPIETTDSPRDGNSFDISSLRVGQIMEWRPRHVVVRVYDDRQEVGGDFKDLTLSKRFVAIVENPLYPVMNETNSTLQRLLKKLSHLDTVDEYASSGKLDLIIQLPYVVKSEARKQQAESRRKDIEVQLREGKYGIAYTDGTEKITQLNRPVENNLLKQIEMLQNQLYSQLGLTPSIFDGTADEAAMLNYQNRTVKPIVRAIAESMKRTFLTKTARTQGQSIEFFTDPFELVPIADIAEIADKFTRNEIMSANEIRAIVGRKPNQDPKADELRNSNMPAPEDSGLADMGELPDGDAESNALGEIDAEITQLLKELEGSDDES